MLLQEKVSIIKLKVKALLKQQQNLQNELLLVQAENEKLKKLLADQTKRIEILEDKNKISKLADGIQLGKRDVTDLKLAINQYIRDIDECLKLLKHYTNNK